MLQGPGAVGELPGGGGGGDARVSLVILLPWQPCTGLVAKKRMDGSFEVESLSAHDISSDWKYEN